MDSRRRLYHRHEGNGLEVDVYPTDMHAFDMLKDDDLSREAIKRFELEFEKALRNCLQESCP